MDAPKPRVEHFPTLHDAVEWMERDAASRGQRLAMGVGSDMSGPFYTASGRHAENYYPHGIPGELVFVSYDRD